MTVLRKLIVAFVVALPMAVLQSPAWAGDIVDIASKAGNFTTLTKAIKQAGLEETLKGEGPYTLFAPTDEAFAKVPERLLQALFHPPNKEGLALVLKYHVLSGKMLSKDLAGKMHNLKTLQGDELAIDATKELMADKAIIVTADIAASNGVIHAVDTLILPPDLRGSF